MANSAVYVKLTPKGFERLRRVSDKKRRQPGDQAALMLERLLEEQELKELESEQAAA